MVAAFEAVALGGRWSAGAHSRASRRRSRRSEGALGDTIWPSKSLAKELGFACQDLRSLRRDFAQMLFSRMTNRLGKAVYQTISFTMSFPRTAAQSLFPSHLLTNQCEKNLDWKASTLPEISELISDMLSELSPAASGLTRAVQLNSARAH